MSTEETIAVGTYRDQSERTPVEMPVVQLLTGRGLITGKSGSGKSNTASVVIEELLAAGYPVLIVDTDGEYYGLKEQFELLHAGADEECDIQVGPEHAGKLAELALEENVPIILDVSGYLDEDRIGELIRETARQLFAKEKKLKKPFLLVVEEIHEYVPEGGGLDDTGRMLIKISKRGRKHGLGIIGISQRPADVKKDFITQANWIVWHRLTWNNDTAVVRRVLDADYAEAVADLDDGEGFLQADWTDSEARRVQFRRKRTFDAGATPGLEDFERPELKSVSDTLVEDLQSISDAEQQRADRIAQLETELDRREQRIDELETELQQARDVSVAARQIASAVSDGDIEVTPGERIDQLQARIEQLESKREEAQDRIEELKTERDEAYDRIEALETENDRLRQELQETTQQVQRSWPADDAEPSSVRNQLRGTAVGDRIETIIERSECTPAIGWALIEDIADQPQTADRLAQSVDARVQHVWMFLSDLRQLSCVTRDLDGRYRLDLSIAT